MTGKIPRWKQVCVGDKYHGVEVVGPVKRRKSPDGYSYTCDVLCASCGARRSVDLHGLLRGSVSKRCATCGTATAGFARWGTSKLLDVRVGDEFGDWTVIGDVEYSRDRKNNRSCYMCRVRCACGYEREIHVHNLVYKKSTQCCACEAKKLWALPDFGRGCTVRVT